MKLVEVSEKEFLDFSKKCPATNFLQSVEMYRRYQKRGDESYLVGLFQGEKMVAGALLVSKYKVLGQKMFICPRGFLADFNSSDFCEILRNFTVLVKKFLRVKNAAVLEISPNIVRTAKVDKDGVPTENYLTDSLNMEFTKLGYVALGEYEFVKWIYALSTDNLREGELLSRLRTDHRRTTRLSEDRYGLRVRELDASELGILKDLSNEAAERHGFVTPEISYYKEMKEVYGDKVKFLVVEADKKVVQAFEEGKDAETISKIAEKVPVKIKDGVPVAAAMFIFWPTEVIYLFSGSSSKYRKFGGPHLLQYKMIQETIKRGIKKYNFYGTDPKKGDGVYEFKRGYHGELQEYIGTYMLPISLIGKIYAKKQKYKDVRDIH